MTNAELNKICCDFAGIEPTNTSTSETGEKFLWYPPVSSDWEAAGRLMDALRAKGAWLLFDRGWRAVGRGQTASSCYQATVGIRGRTKGESGISDSGPMALALAVAELAKEFAR